jgi:hypothetical protein
MLVLFLMNWAIDKKKCLTNHRLMNRRLTKIFFDKTSFDKITFDKTSFDETTFDKTLFDEKTWYLLFKTFFKIKFNLIF